MLAAEGAGHLCEERAGLPCAGHGRFQPVPAGSSGSAARHSRAPQLVVPQGKSVYKGQKNAGQTEEEGEKSEHPGQKRRMRRRKRCSRRRSSDSPSARGETVVEPGKGVRRKELLQADHSPRAPADVSGVKE